MEKSNSSKSIRKKEVRGPGFPFAKNLLKWYAHQRRDLPWRASNDPYRVWLSEIMLQQTRVNQAIGYYYRFLAAFPTVADLAAAPQQEVLKLWQGLGYYSRARNLHIAAQQVVNEHGGQFPSVMMNIKELKGIGPYTAAAIGSICFGHAQPAVDGNALRVISRFFGLTVPVNTPAGYQAVESHMHRVMDPTCPGDFNQAVMELGASLCSPKKPQCGECPLRSGCVAYLGALTSQIPVRLAKKQAVPQDICYLVVRYKDRLYMRQRGSDSIWANMFDFPQWTSATDAGPHIPGRAQIRKLTGEWPDQMVVSDPVTHLLTHRRLQIRFVFCQLKRTWKNAPDNVQAVKLSELHKLPVPVPVANYLRPWTD